MIEIDNSHITPLNSWNEKSSTVERKENNPQAYQKMRIEHIHKNSDMVTISDEARAMSKAFSAKSGWMRGKHRTDVLKEDTAAIADLNNRAGKLKDEIVRLIAKGDETGKRQLANKHKELVTLYNRLAQLKMPEQKAPYGMKIIDNEVPHHHS